MSAPLRFEIACTLKGKTCEGCSRRRLYSKIGMQLRVARLCLDCEEVHDGDSCPVCASKAFAFLSRWVPAPERRVRPRPNVPPDGVAATAVATPARPASWVTRGAVGLTVLGLAGWLWHRREAGKKDAAPVGPEPPDESNQASL